MKKLLSLCLIVGVLLGCGTALSEMNDHNREQNQIVSEDEIFPPLGKKVASEDEIFPPLGKEVV
ncbi:hypothetical protein ACQ0QQ_20130 [Lysinibacillus sphaericus]